METTQVSTKSELRLGFHLLSRQDTAVPTDQLRVRFSREVYPVQAEWRFEGATGREDIWLRFEALAQRAARLVFGSEYPEDWIEAVRAFHAERPLSHLLHDDGVSREQVGPLEVRVTLKGHLSDPSLASADYLCELENEEIISPAAQRHEGEMSELRRLVAERAKRRAAVVMPILKKKRWKPGRLATKAGVGKNSVYQYLDGTREWISDENRQAIARELELRPEELPA